MSNIETAQIIQFADAARPKRRPVANHTPSVAKNEEGVSDTAGNQRLRRNRRDVWREAAAVVNYWHICMKMESAISYVQRFDVPEGKLHPVREPKDHGTLIKRYRLAWCHLMLTPAPDMRSVHMETGTAQGRKL